MAMYTYQVLETCWRTDVGPVARKFVENEVIEVPEKINSPKFELINTRGEAPAQKEKIDPQLEALNKKVADRKTG